MSHCSNPPWTAIVIGGCGLLGHHLVKRLLASPDYRTVAVLDQRIENRVENAEYYEADLGYPDVCEIFAKVKPHVVFHTASPASTSNHALHMHVNIEGTRNLLEQALKTSVAAFIYTSSASVIHDGVSDLVEADETAEYVTLPEQREVYSHSKAIAEGHVLGANDPSNGFFTTAIRPVTIYGEGDYPFVGRMVELARSGKARIQIGDGTNLFDYVYVGNLADAHLLAAEKLLRHDSNNKVDGEAFLITDDCHLRFWSLIREIASAAGHPVEPRDIKVVPRRLALVLGFLAEWWNLIWSLGRRRSAFSVTNVRYSTLMRTFDISKAKKRLGYKPKIRTKEGIERAVGWCMKHGEDEKEN